MNKSQTKAIERVRHLLQSRISESAAEKYGQKITKFEVEPTDYGTLWVSAEVDHTALPDTNLLKALDHEHWLISIGKRGAITAHSFPRAFEQFAGSGYLGMNIKSA
jgi:hypothetical protein